MHRIIKIFIVLALALTGWACGDSDSFSISGMVEGKPNMNLYMKYYGDGRVMSGVTRVTDGKFEISGVSRQPTLVVLANNEGRPLAYLVLKNGERASVEINRQSPFLMKASGTPTLEEWSNVCLRLGTDLANGSDAANNSLIEREIAANPGSMASTLLFATAYNYRLDPLRADSVAQSLLPEARTGTLLDTYSTMASRYANGHYLEPVDSIPYRTFKSREVKYYLPSAHKATLLAISTNESRFRLQRRDTIAPALKKLHQEKDFDIFDLSIAADTNTWKNDVRPDSAKWIQGWTPGGIFARGIAHLALPTVPYYLALDSAGRQIYRGESLDSAAAVARSLYK